MKNILIVILVAGVTLFNSCKNSENKKQESMPEKSNAVTFDTSAEAKNIKEISPTFTNINSQIASSVTLIINKYLELKNALADNNETEAREKGKELGNALSRVDKTLLNEEQKKVFAQEEAELKEDAEHIGKSKIEHQRMHFSMLSQSILTIAKAFGAGRPLYDIYCAKAENGTGAIWLSESIDHKNPYIEDAKAECFSIQEKIK
jgi:predicted hydrocarbon binding protein